MTNVELPSGVVLPKGMTFTIDLANMNTNERVWGKGALEFNPARFLNAEETKKRHPYQYLPFGGGKRNCIGKNFAMQEVKILLLRIASQVRV